MNRIVGWPVFSRRFNAPTSTRRMSATLDSTPLKRSNLLLVCRAMICASDVLPVPAAEENQRLNAVGLDGAAQQLSRRENVRLPGKFVEIARAHPRGERLVSGSFRSGRGFRPGFSRFLEQIIARHAEKLASSRRIAQNKKAASGAAQMAVGEFRFEIAIQKPAIRCRK